MLIEDGDPVWLELTTPDLSASQDFYSRLFGWSFEESGPDRVTALVDGRPVGGLVAKDVPEAQWQVYIQVSDIADTATTAVAARGHILVNPSRAAESDIHDRRVALLEDPAGAVIGIMEHTDFPGLALGTEHGLPTWFEVAGRDLRVLLGFYHLVFGWRYHYVDEDGIMSTVFEEDVEFASNGPAGHATAGVVAGADDADTGWRAYVAVERLGEAVAMAESAGGRVDMEFIDGHLGRHLTVVDPHGAAITLLEAAR